MQLVLFENKFYLYLVRNNTSQNTDEFNLLLDAQSVQKNGIVSFLLTGDKNFDIYPLCSGIFVYLLIETGKGQISISGKKYPVKPLTLVVLSPEYVGQFSEISSDFKVDILFVTKTFLDTLPASDKMYRHITKVLLQQRQVNSLTKQQFLVLSETVKMIQKKLNLTAHYLKREIVQNALAAFLLEVSNIWIENHWDLLNEPHQIHFEYILKSFFNSLMQNYRREHLVSFYADQLSITPQYLSLIIKDLTGRTPSQFIFERLYCEARALLDCPDLSIKEIAEQLYFSDQSAFGKFFKKRSGISPVDFRKKRQIR